MLGQPEAKDLPKTADACLKEMSRLLVCKYEEYDAGGESARYWELDLEYQVVKARYYELRGGAPSDG
jgi:hypothetical protein